MVSFKECGTPVCPLPRTYEGPCIGQYRKISKVYFVQSGKQYRCKEKKNENYKKIRCACPTDKTVVTACHKEFRKIRTTLFRISRENVCYRRTHSVKWRCACPAPKREKGPCIGRYRKDKIKMFRRYTIQPGHIRCLPFIRMSKPVLCGCKGPKRTIEKCKHNFKIITEMSWKFKNNKCLGQKKVHEKRCSCPNPTFQAEDCKKKEIVVRGYFQFVRKNSNGCRTDVWIKKFNCDRKCSSVLDLAIIIDSSDSVQKKNFIRMKTFIKALIKQYNIGRNKTRVALMIYSSLDSIRLIFPFMSYLKKETMLERIDNMLYRPGSTSTGAALRDFRKRVAIYTHGLRKNSRKVVVLLTDGAANDKKYKSVLEARKLRALKFRIIAIGIGTSINKKMLRRFASKPFQNNVFVSKFSSMKTLLVAHKSTFAHLHCSLGRMNKFAVMGHLKQKVLDLTEGKTRVTEGMLKALDFIRLPTHNMYKVTVYIVGDLDKMLAFNTPTTRKSLEEQLKKAVAKKLGLSKFNIHGFHIPSISSSKCPAKKSDEVKRRRRRAAGKDPAAVKSGAKKKAGAKGKKTTGKKVAGAKKKTADAKSGAKKTTAGTKSGAKKETAGTKSGAKKATAGAKGGAKKKTAGPKGKKTTGKKVGGGKKCFEIRFLYAKVKISKLLAVKEFMAGAAKHKVHSIVYTTPDVRRVHRECTLAIAKEEDLVHYFAMEYARLQTNKAKIAKVKAIDKDAHTLKVRMKKIEGPIKKGNNALARSMLKKLVEEMLKILLEVKDLIHKMSPNKKADAGKIIHFQDLIQKRLEQSHLIDIVKNIVNVLTTDIKKASKSGKGKPPKKGKGEPPKKGKGKPPKKGKGKPPKKDKGKPTKKDKGKPPKEAKGKPTKKAGPTPKKVPKKPTPK